MTKREPLVSIVTPTRDQAQFVEHTLRSVRNQTYPHIQHIVVDGGSTDATPDILGRYESTYDLEWWSEPDNGMYQAINRGFARARGEVLAYLNSDDLYFPWSVELAVRALESGADLVYGDGLLLDDATGAIRPHFQLPYRRSYLLTIGSLAQPATWWRRSLYERAGAFDESLRSAADLDFYLRATAVGPTRHIREFMAIMRIHPAMQTIAAAPRLRAEIAAVRDRHQPRGRRRAASHVIERVIAWGRRRRAWAQFLRSVWHHGDPDRPWGRFIDEGVRLRPLRILAGQVPFAGPRLLPGAIWCDRDWRRWP